MAEVVAPETLKRAVGRARVEYPWGEWADGQTRLVTQGKDFACSAKSFRSVLSKYGSQNGLKAVIGTADPEAPEAVVFRFEPRPEGWTPTKRARKVIADTPEHTERVAEALTGVVEAPEVEAEPVAEDAPAAEDSMDW